jgi:hypothetical protein
MFREDDLRLCRSIVVWRGRKHAVNLWKYLLRYDGPLCFLALGAVIREYDVQTGL